MDSPPAAAPVSPLRPSVWLRAFLIAGFVAYAVFLARHVGASAGGSDSSGYLNNARLLAEGRTAMPQRVPPGLDATQFDWFAFMPLGFRPLPAAKMAPTYPIGLPIALLSVAKLVGWQLAPPLIMVASALLAVALMLPLGRAAGLPLGWSAFGALLLAASPLTTFMSVQLMSDVPATAAATAAILCAWRSRTRPVWALLAGAALALGVLIRPTNLLLLAPIGLCLGLNWRRWLFLGLGGVPGTLAQLAYSAAAYGNPLASGYGGDLGSKFSLGIVPVTLAHYVRWLPVLLTPVGILALALPWIGRRQQFAWVLIAWIVPLFTFYAGYFHTHEWWWYLRFLLPAFPACLVGGLWVAHLGWTRLNAPRLKTPLNTRSIAVAAALVVVAHGAFWDHRLAANTIGDGESVYAETFAWTRTHLPADATLLAMQMTGALVYYTDYHFVRWDMLNAEHFARVTRAAVATHRPLFAVLFPFEVNDALETHAAGHWTQVGAVRQVTIWQWSPGPAALEKKSAPAS